MYYMVLNEFSMWEKGLFLIFSASHSLNTSEEAALSYKYYLETEYLVDPIKNIICFKKSVSLFFFFSG